MVLPMPLSWTSPREADLGLIRIGSAEASASLLPNGSLFALDCASNGGRLMVNQILGSPVASGIGRVCLRTGGVKPSVRVVTGPGPGIQTGADRDRIVWESVSDGLHCCVTLWFAPATNVWLWRLEAVNQQDSDIDCDAILIQDLGLGERGFLMNNEAYASQYIDHHVEHDVQCGPVIMSRQNLAQRGGHPWVLHGCFEGAAAFATDALQTFGPGFRNGTSLELGFARNLPSERLQHEVACIALQSQVVRVKPGSTATWTFFAVFDPNHSEASGGTDLSRIAIARDGASDFLARKIDLKPTSPSLVDQAAPLAAEPLDHHALAHSYPVRLQEETSAGSPLSFFVHDGAFNRHVVFAAKEGIVARRHGALLRSGQSMLPDDTLLCATTWMHGVFAAQLTIGNTSFHKLFSVSRDPYNITRASGLRVLVDLGQGWRLLAVPSVFEIGLSDCRWEYKIQDRRIVIRSIASGDDPAMVWQVTVDGPPCRFLVCGHLVLGEREFEQTGRVTIDAVRHRFSFAPDPSWLWGQRYPDASYHLVTDTPAAIEAMGGDELLFPGGVERTGSHVVIRTYPVNEFRFAVTGSLTDRAESNRLAEKYEAGVDGGLLLTSAAHFWNKATRGTRITGANQDAAAFDTVFPWLVQNAMIHLTVPRGLEQYTGAAWGTRDVCQGPVEFLLTLEHDETVKDILRIIFAQQYEQRGDWPQWFMLEPYSNIQDPHAHGDVILWPLKALCDYIEATNDLAFLDEPIAWRGDTSLAKTECTATTAAHVDKLIETACSQFIPGTSLLRYGEGDWNDSLQPADPAMRDWMVSSWTVALFVQQLERYADVLRRAGRTSQSGRLQSLATSVKEDFNTHLVRNGTVAGYAIFNAAGGEPELLLHPADQRTGLKYSLLPMQQAIIGGLFSPEQIRHHMGLIREHLAFPDGVRLMDRPVAYSGGLEHFFRRAESSAFFGREIGLMYVHAHLRYAEALATIGDAAGLWSALATVNPVAVNARVANAGPRQRNTYFSSSDARFLDRYHASSDWHRVRDGAIAVDGGWRIYSSGPGLFINMLIRHSFGQRRYFGERLNSPMLPELAGDVRLTRQ